MTTPSLLMCWPPSFSSRSRIASLHHKYAQSAILNIANHPAIAHPVTPEAAQRASQRLACAARVFQPGDTLVHEIDDAPCRLLVELL